MSTAVTTIPLSYAMLYKGIAGRQVVTHADLPDFDPTQGNALLHKALALVSMAGGGKLMTNMILTMTKDQTYALLQGEGFAIVWGNDRNCPADMTPEQVGLWVDDWLANRVHLRLDFSLQADSMDPNNYTVFDATDFQLKGVPA